MPQLLEVNMLEHAGYIENERYKKEKHSVYQGRKDIKGDLLTSVKRRRHGRKYRVFARKSIYLMGKK